MKKIFSTLVFAISLAAIVLASAFPSSKAKTTAAAPSPPAEPIVKLQGVDGRFYDVAEMRGNVVLISFGATWCAPCSAELAALEELKREYAAKPVKFFWVSIESPAQISDGKLKAYAKEHKLTMPVLRDPTRTTLLQFTQRVRLPLIVFFGKDGRFDEPTHFGMSSEPDIYKTRIRERLDKLLAAGRSEVDRHR